MSVRQIHQSAAASAAKPKLLDQVRATIRRKHYSIRTEESYVDWIKRYIFFHHKRHPAEMDEREVEQFLNHLAVQLHVAASTQNQALSALVFLYREVLRKEARKHFPFSIFHLSSRKLTNKQHRMEREWNLKQAL